MKRQSYFGTDRHIRWNWEQSPDNPMLVRYHVVVVDDKKRSRILEGIFQQIQRVNSGIEVVRKVRGNVSGSKMKYLFSSFDASSAPSVINWTRTGKAVRQDTDLYERKRGNIEDYVSRVYES